MCKYLVFSYKLYFLCHYVSFLYSFLWSKSESWCFIRSNVSDVFILQWSSSFRHANAAVVVQVSQQSGKRGDSALLHNRPLTGSGKSACDGQSLAASLVYPKPRHLSCIYLNPSFTDIIIKSHSVGDLKCRLCALEFTQTLLVNTVRCTENRIAPKVNRNLKCLNRIHLKKKG